MTFIADPRAFVFDRDEGSHQHIWAVLRIGDDAVYRCVKPHWPLHSSLPRG